MTRRLIVSAVAALVALVAGPLAATTAAVAAPAASAATTIVGDTFLPVNTARVYQGTITTTASRITVAGRGGVPTSAVAVVLDVEVSAPTASGSIAVVAPGSSTSAVTQSFVAGSQASNSTTVRLVNGQVELRLSKGSGTVALDVSGYYIAGAGGNTYVPTTPVQMYGGTVGTTAQRVQVGGVSGIPSTANAAAVEVLVSGSTSSGWVRVTPAGHDAQTTFQEFARGRTIGNAGVVRLVGGALQVRVSAGTAHVTVAITGYYTPDDSGSVFTPIGTTHAFAGTVSTSARAVQLTGTVGVPGIASAIVANVGVQSPTAAASLRFGPYGVTSSIATQGFLAKGSPISTMAQTTVRSGKAQLSVTAGSVGATVDVVGYFLHADAGSGVGADVSYPQAGKTLPSGQSFGIVGVNGNLANQPNPGLADQLSWAQGTTGATAQARTQLYVLTADPGKAAASSWPTSNRADNGVTVSNPYGTCANTDSTACAYVYGYDRAVYDAGLVSGPSAYRWWLDVEWAPTDGPSWLTGTTGLAMNQADLEGVAAGLRAAGVSQIGLYSTSLQLAQVIHTPTTSSTLSGLPDWIPIGEATLPSAQAACADAPLTPGGKVVMTQYLVTSGSTSQDYDNSCV
jgi:hypothetical protein